MIVKQIYLQVNQRDFHTGFPHNHVKNMKILWKLLKILVRRIIVLPVQNCNLFYKKTRS